MFQTRRCASLSTSTSSRSWAAPTSVGTACAAATGCVSSRGLRPTPRRRLPPAERTAFGGHGDGLALVRGNLAHAAIRAWFTTGDRPNLAALLARQNPTTGGPAALRALAEVDEMLDRFDGGELARLLRHAGTRAHFKLPFGWYCDGAPVHGTIDLAYEHAGRWHLVDFKTDDVRLAQLKQAAAPYLGQIALYAGALQQATGQAPSASLHFLRPGATYRPDPEELSRALAATRSREP